MLIELTIRNIALIENLQLEFAKGFNVLTGETGAGKSIVVDSINLMLGGRADRDIIRTGAEKGFVQALFDVTDNAAAVALMEENGITPEDGYVTITRELNRSGRNVCRVCGVIVQLAVLKSITALLMEVHGQHEHQSLMNTANHMGFLDSFGDEAHQARIESVAEAYKRRNAVRTELKTLMKDAAERERLTDILRFQINEIDSAKLKEGEEEKLVSQLKVLENSEKIRNNVELAYQMVYAGGGGAISAQEAALKAANAMQSIADIDPRYRKLGETLRSVYYLAQEAGAELQALEEELNYDPALQARIADRLDVIEKLERKYGATEAEVIAFAKAAKERLATIDASDDKILQLKKEYKSLDKALREKCDELTQSRRAIATDFEGNLLLQLKDLGMAKTRFEVRIESLEKPASTGLDSIEFMISPNPGEPLKPLSSTASGGELSRIMLAMRVISLDSGAADSMVFDEIDTGVSGRMAQVVGEKMLTIGTRDQVLCVTHLPQIAALGDMHFKVEKYSENERTITQVIPLDRAGRIREISRLVGGSEDSKSSLSHAEHMLQDADDKRREIAGKIGK